MMIRMSRSALVGSVLIGVACAKPTQQRTPEVPVRITRVMKISAPVTIIANGVVEPVQTVAIRAQVGGVLTQVTFREGDDITEGQVLFRIDPRPFEDALRQAQAALARDEALAESARRDAERYNALVAKDYVTKSQADQTKANAAALAATVHADEVAVENARLNLSYTTIRAPITGRTGSILVDQGNLVSANSAPLVVIHRVQPIRVRFPVPQREFSALQRRASIGSVPVHVSGSDSLPIPEAGELSFIDNAVDSLTGTVSAKARFRNGDRQLWPGEYVKVNVELQVQNNLMVVPTEAIQSGPDGAYVFVVDQAHTARLRLVSAGRAVGSHTVIERGLAAGETVVVDGQSRLTPGAKVSIESPAPAGKTGP